MADAKLSIVAEIFPKMNAAAATVIKNQFSSLTSLQSQAADLKRAYAEVDKMFAKTIGGVAKLDKEIKATHSGLERFGAGLVGYFTRFASFTVAASAVFKAYNAISDATQKFVDFDNKLTRLRQITGSTRADLKGITTETFRLATGLGVTQSSLADAAETLAQAGYTARQTEEALQALAKADIAPTFDNMKDTTDGLIATLNQFGKSTADAEKILSQLNAVAAGFAVESGDLIKGIQRAGGVFAQSGSSLEEFLALFTAVRQTTREAPETIAQGLKTIVTRIQRVSTDEFLKRLGIHGIRDATTKEFVGAYKAVEILSKGVRHLGKGSPELAALVEELGGIRQVGKVLPLLYNFNIAQKAYQTAISGSNSLTKDAIIAQESLSRQFAKTSEEFTKLINTLLSNRGFTDFIKTINDAAQSLIRFAAQIEPVFPYITFLLSAHTLRAGISVARGGLAAVKKLGTVPGKAQGGLIPGHSSRDDYPALLMRGEYIVSKKGVNAVGSNFLDMVNSGHLPRFALGTGGPRKPSFTLNEDQGRTRSTLIPVSDIENFIRNFLQKLGPIAEKAVKKVLVQKTVTSGGRDAGGTFSLSSKNIRIAEKSSTEETAIHEMAHAIDLAISPKKGHFASSIPGTAQHAFVQDLLPRVQAKAAARGMKPGEDAKHGGYGYDYYTSPYEIFARAFIHQPPETRALLAKTTDPSKFAATNTGIAGFLGSMGPGDTKRTHGATQREYERLRKADPTLGASAALQQARMNTITSSSTTGNQDIVKMMMSSNKPDYYRALAETQHHSLVDFRHLQKQARTASTTFPTFTKGLQKLGGIMPSIVESTGKIPAYTKRISAGISTGSTALLLASNTDLFNNTVDNLSGGGKQGAATGGAIRGGLTGLAVGSMFGPWGSVMGAVAGATQGAVSAVKSYTEAIQQNKVAASSKAFDKDQNIDTLRGKINSLSGTTELKLREKLGTFGLLNLNGTQAQDLTSQTQAEVISESGVGQNLLSVLKAGIQSGQFKSVEDINKIPGFNTTELDLSTTAGLNVDNVINKTLLSPLRILGIELDKGPDAVNKFLQGLFDAQAAEEEKARHSLMVSEKIFETSKALQSFTHRINMAGLNLPDTNIKSIGDPSSLINRFTGLAKPGSAQFADAIGDLPISEKDKFLALNVNKGRESLTNTMSKAPHTGSLEDFTKFLRSDLYAQGVNQSIVDALINAIPAEEFQKFQDMMSDGITQPIEQLMQKSGLAEFERSVQKAGQDWSQFTGAIVDDTGKLLGHLGNAEEAKLTQGQVSVANKRQLDQLMGRTTEAGVDNAMITESIVASVGTANVDALGVMLDQFDALSKTLPEYAEASKYVTSALKKLGDTSGRTGDIMTRIGEVERSRAAKISLRERFITGDPAARREMTTNMALAKEFVATGAKPEVFEGMSLPLQRAVTEGLRQFGDANIGDSGKTGTRVLEDTLGKPFGETGERDKLIGDLTKIYSEIDTINEIFALRQASIYDDFLGKYEGLNASFLTKFASILKVDPRGFPTGTGAPDTVFGVKPGGFFSVADTETPRPKVKESMDAFNTNFGMNIAKLNEVAAAIPHTISMNVNHKLEIIHNGAQVFESLQPSFVALANAVVSQAINNLIKQKFPDVGQLAMDLPHEGDLVELVGG